MPGLRVVGEFEYQLLPGGSHNANKVESEAGVEKYNTGIACREAKCQH